ncbi:MAG: YbaK/EbsC family protein [Candidatus Nanopelagicales bacterium]
MAKKSVAVHTNATKVLYQANVPYAIHQYEQSEAATQEQQGLHPDAFDHPERVFRTIVTVVDDEPLAALVPVDCVLDGPLVAAAVGGESATIADSELAAETTGFPANAVSPLGTKSDLPVLIDVCALDFKTIYVSAGEEGFTIELAPADLLTLTNARTAPIARRL